MQLGAEDPDEQNGDQEAGQGVADNGCRLPALVQRSADYDLVLFMQLFYVAMSLLGNLIVDLVYGMVDPRVRVNK